MHKHVIQMTLQLLEIEDLREKDKQNLQTIEDLMVKNKQNLQTIEELKAQLISAQAAFSAAQLQISQLKEGLP